MKRPVTESPPIDADHSSEASLPKIILKLPKTPPPLKFTIKLPPKQQLPIKKVAPDTGSQLESNKRAKLTPKGV